MIRAASIGECMLEIADAGDGTARLGFAGDTYNTAYYLRHLTGPEVEVAYVSAVGTDGLSEEMLEGWRRAGIRCDRVGRVVDRVPGAYLIRTTAAGERSFVYWRDASAARALFQPPAMAPPAETLAGFDLLYLSGITLAILPAGMRRDLVEALARARGRGALTVFDPNHRPRLWPDAAVARDAYREIAAAGALVLPSFDDERGLFGDRDPAASAERWLGWGAGAVVVKDGERPVRLAVPGVGRDLPVPPAPAIVDTTAAGDSFNAGVLAALVAGGAATPEGTSRGLDALESAAAYGCRVAAIVIGRRGALVDPALLPRL